MFEYLQTYVLQYVGQRIMFDMRMQIYGHLQRVDVQYYDQNPVGRLMTRVTTDVDVLNDLFASGVVSVFGDVFTLAGIMIVLLQMDWRLALVAFSVLPLIVLITQWFRRNVRDSYRTVRVWIAKINAFLQEQIGGIATVQLFRREAVDVRAVRRDRPRAPRRQHRVDLLLRRVLPGHRGDGRARDGADHLVRRGAGARRRADARHARGLHPVLAPLLPADQRHLGEVQPPPVGHGVLGADLQAAGYGTHHVSGSGLTPRLRSGCPERGREATESKGTAQGSRLDPEARVPVPSADGPGPEAGSRKPEAGPGSIRFDHVWFAYGGEDYVLKDVSFQVEPGQRIGVVGATGAGKSTVINLLMRFYDVSRGRILVDGVDIREMDLGDLRARFSLVLQDVQLFSGTIASNIRLGSTASDEEVRRAAEAVHAAGFIDRLPNGLASEVGERGASLSVGQKQLLSFARALAFDPPVLVLDEATSSVDTDTEWLIRDALKVLMTGRTTIAIAHRLSTIQDMDRILVFHKGELRESGAHQELLAQRGIYYRLYQLQYKEQESAAVAGTGR